VRLASFVTPTLFSASSSVDGPRECTHDLSSSQSCVSEFASLQTESRCVAMIEGRKTRNSRKRCENANAKCDASSLIRAALSIRRCISRGHYLRNVNNGIYRPHLYCACNNQRRSSGRCVTIFRATARRAINYSARLSSTRDSRARERRNTVRLGLRISITLPAELTISPATIDERAVDSS